jgi:hypothetical protein
VPEIMHETHLISSSKSKLLIYDNAMRKDKLFNVSVVSETYED